MKVIYYNQRIMSEGKYDYDDSNWYIPNKKVIICESGTISKEGVIKVEKFLIESTEALNRIKSIIKGNPPKLGNLIYSNIKEQEYNSHFLKELIKNLKKFNNLEIVVNSGFNKLSKE